MFGKVGMRIKIAVCWLLSLTLLWSTFKITFPISVMRNQLDKIEQSVAEGNWKEADNYTSEFRNTFMQRRFLIQLNNSTEIFTLFEHTIGQLEVTVTHHQDSSLEYIGALRETLNLVVKPFAGP